MRLTTARVVLLVLALLPLALGLRELQQTPAKLQGKITINKNTKGMRVVAIETKSGRAKVAALNSLGQFVFNKLSAGIYTLSLIKPTGAYFGPVQCKAIKTCTTVNNKQVCTYSQVLLSVKNTGDMGTLTMGSTYANVPAANQKNVCFEGTGKIVARAVNGVAVGAGRLGLVKKVVAKKAVAPKAAAVIVTAAAPSQPGQDQDGDGIVGAMDVDDDGDMVVDNVDPTSQIPVTDATKAFYIFSNYKVTLDKQINFYLPDTTLTAVNTVFKERQTLAMAGMPRPGTSLAAIVKDVRLNCLGLSYCKPGGSGIWMGSLSGSLPFPGDTQFEYNEALGGGKMLPSATGDFQLKPNASPSAVKAGDTFAITANLKNGTQYQFVGTLNTVFYSTPAITGYSNPIVLPNEAFQAPAGYPAGYLQLDFSGYRPQRARYPGETFDSAVAGSKNTSQYVDIGRLGWQIWATVQPNGRPRACSSASIFILPGSKDAERTDTWTDTTPDLPAGHNSPIYRSAMTWRLFVNSCLKEADYFKGVTSPDPPMPNPCNPWTPQCDCSKLPNPKPIQCNGGGGGGSCNPYTPMCDCSTLGDPKPNQCSVPCTPHFTPNCNCLATPVAQRPPECSGGGGGGGGSCNPYTPMCDCGPLNPKPTQCTVPCTPTNILTGNCNCLATPVAQRPPQCMTNQPQSQRALLSLEQHSTRKLAQTGSLWKPGYTICFMVTARSQFNDNAETSICFKRPAQ